MRVYADGSNIMFSCECGEKSRVPNSKSLHPFMKRLRSFENKHKYCKHNEAVKSSVIITSKILEQLQAGQ
jgi:hypothetical protein